MTNALMISEAPTRLNWDVIEQNGDYVLLWTNGPSPMNITPVETPLGIAIDAACDFMDRIREGNTPPFISNDAELMQFCVGRSWKQS